MKPSLDEQGLNRAEEISNLEAIYREQIVFAVANASANPGALQRACALVLDASRNRIIYLPVATIIEDEIGGKAVRAAIAQMWENSTCPHVAAFRSAIAKSHADSWADVIAQHVCDL